MSQRPPRKVGCPFLTHGAARLQDSGQCLCPSLSNTPRPPPPLNPSATCCFNWCPRGNKAMAATVYFPWEASRCVCDRLCCLPPGCMGIRAWGAESASLASRRHSAIQISYLLPLVVQKECQMTHSYSSLDSLLIILLRYPCPGILHPWCPPLPHASP